MNSEGMQEWAQSPTFHRPSLGLPVKNETPLHSPRCALYICQISGIIKAYRVVGVVIERRTNMSRPHRRMFGPSSNTTATAAVFLAACVEIENSSADHRGLAARAVVDPCVVGR